MKKKIFPCICLILAIFGGYTLVNRNVEFEASEFVEVAINSSVNKEIKVHGEIQVGILSTILNPVGSFYHSHRKWFSIRTHSSEFCFTQKLIERDKKRRIGISVPCEISILKVVFRMGKREKVFSWTVDDLRRLVKNEHGEQYAPRRFGVVITIDENQEISHEIFIEKEDDDHQS